MILDLDTHHIIDILPDREAESVKKWLAAHPEIEVVSRDRGGAYADGAAEAGSTSDSMRRSMAYV